MAACVAAERERDAAERAVVAVLGTSPWLPPHDGEFSTAEGRVLQRYDRTAWRAHLARLRCAPAVEVVEDADVQACPF